MRKLLIVLSILLLPLNAARADVSVDVGVGFNIPGARIGVHISSYPRLVAIPGYPVYYDPYVDLNFFFYDGMYWVLQGDSWYVSSWYDGPWQLVEPMYVPVFILRIPVRYFRRPPPFFHGWHLDEAPHWGEHWGHDWEHNRKGWNEWDHRSAPHYAPLPSYQRHYSGKRYPQEMDRQRSIELKKYRYQPRSSETQRYYKQNHDKSDQRGKPEQRGQSEQHGWSPQRGQSDHRGKTEQRSKGEGRDNDRR